MLSSAQGVRLRADGKNQLKILKLLTLSCSLELD